MVGLEAWILVLTGETTGRPAQRTNPDGSARRTTPSPRSCGAPPKSVVLARRGETEEADRVTAEAVAIADGTDSMDAGTAWLARALGALDR